MSTQTDDKNARIYPCKDCGEMRSKAEGGTTFTVCDECWDKHFRPSQTDDLEAKAREWWLSKHPGFYEADEREVSVAAAFALSLAHPPAQEVVEAGNAMRKYVQDHGWSKRERMDPQSEIFRLVSAWDAALASQPKEVAPTVEPVAIRRQRTASLTVDLIVEVRDSILRLMGYGVDMPTVEEIIIDLAKPTRP